MANDSSFGVFFQALFLFVGGSLLILASLLCLPLSYKEGFFPLAQPLGQPIGSLPMALSWWC
jgi:hypothetical protein